jgi:predicted acylesterase/phospholipase RssA
MEIHQQISSRSHALCERLLNEIAAAHGHSGVDPDHSTATSTATSSWARALEEKSIDIVISGGGLKGYFVTGASVVLKRELDARGITIARAAGTSAGAWAAMFLLLGITTNDWIETYYACQDRPHVTIHEAYGSVIPWLKQRLPANSWEICNNRLHICITEVSLTGLKRHVISEFHNNDDLYEACLASSTIPVLSEKTGLRRYRNMWVIDGAYL